MNIQYHVQSLGEIRREHSLTNSSFIQLYVNELADMLHLFVNLIMPSPASKIETISDATVVLPNVYEVMVISGWANKITTYTSD